MTALASNIVAFDNCWTWFNDPRAVYDPIENILYFGGISSTGFISVYSWDFHRRIYLQGTPRSTVLDIDDHSNPTLVQLASGKLLCFYSVHNGDSFVARTTNANDIRTWDAAVTLSSGATDSSYHHAFQMGDTAESILDFYRDETGVFPDWDIGLRVSTDDGATWDAGTVMFSNVSERPYFKAHQTSSTRIDFVLSAGQPEEIPNSLYHGYLTIAANGTISWFQTDGTAVTNPPMAPSEFTLIYDGTTNDGWQWDVCNIGGTPVILYSVFTSSDAIHTYFQARWNGSAWQSDEVTTGGTTATEDWLYVTGGEHYSGGICQDPNNINTVFAVREYGAADFRLEKWTHTGSFPSGTWAKDSDTSGNTSSVNARPYCPRGLSPTRVIWWEGTYTTYESFNTKLRMDPAPNWRGDKATTPAYQSGYAPTGTNAYFLMHEGSGTALADLANARDGVITGSPTWNAGDATDFGAFLSAFSDTAYVEIDEVGALFGNATYPKWIAVLLKTTSTGTTFQCHAGCGLSTDAQPVFALGSSNAAATNVTTFFRAGLADGGLYGANDAEINTGEYAVVMVIDRDNDHEVYINGRQIVNDTTSVGAMPTLDRGAIGALRRGTVGSASAAEIHAVLFGISTAPDPRWLAMDLLRGQFAGTFDPDVVVSTGTLGLLGVGA